MPVRVFILLFGLQVLLDNQGSSGQLYSPPAGIITQPDDNFNDVTLSKTSGGETDGLTLVYGGILYNMTTTGKDIIKIHQLLGCINFGNKALATLLTNGPPAASSVADPPIFCPFLNKLVDQDLGLTGIMQYAVVKNASASTVAALVQNVAADIAAVSINPGLSLSINRIYVFTWTSVTASDGATVSFQTTLVVANNFRNTFIIFKYGSISSSVKTAWAGVNLGGGNGWYPLPFSGSGLQGNWSQGTFIYRADLTTPILLGCKQPYQMSGADLSLSATSGSLFSAQRLFVQGPCFANPSTDKVSLRFNPKGLMTRSIAGTYVAGTVISKQLAVFRQPVMPELEPGWYTLTVVVNNVEVTQLTADFLLSNPLPNFDGAVLYEPNQFLQLNPSTGPSFTVNWNIGSTQIGTSNITNFQVQIAVLGYPMPWNASAANQNLTELGNWTTTSTPFQLSISSCQVANCQNYIIGHIAVRLVPGQDVNYASPYVELRSLPVMLGWHQQSGVGDKQTWLNGKCETWINTLGSQRLRDLVASESGFQCPCTLDRALADSGFGFADPACTSTYCQYGNYSADITCLMSYGLSTNGFGLRCCYTNSTKQLLYTPMAPSTRSYLNQYHITTLGNAQQNGAYDWLSYYLSEVSGWYACCSQQPTSQYCAKFADSRAVPSNCAAASSSGAASIVGDPHVVTLGGNNYTFQGAGEFVFLQSSDGTLKIQTRLLKNTGIQRPDVTTGDATLLTSIVVQYSSFYAVEVRISPSTLIAQKKLTVIVNKQVVTFYMPAANQITASVTVQSSLQIIVSNSDQSRVQLKYLQSQLFIDCQYIPITSSVGEMSCRLQIPLSYQNQTSGLVGNWQSNPTQDLRPPSYSSNYYFDPSNSSAFYTTLVNAYKLLNATNSLFFYPSGETFENFKTQSVNPDFSQTPTLSPLITDISTITSTCGASAQCVYDAYYLGSLTAAASTRDLVARATADQSLLNVSYASSYCPYPDVPYAVMSLGGLQNGASLTITGCQTGFNDNLPGTTSCTCNAPNWSCDLASLRCRCIGSCTQVAEAGFPWWVVGAAVGGVLLVLIIIAIVVAVVMVIRRRRQKQAEEEAARAARECEAEEAAAAEKAAETPGPNGEQPLEQVPLQTMPQGPGGPPPGGASDPSVIFQPIPTAQLSPRPDDGDKNGATSGAGLNDYYLHGAGNPGAAGAGRPPGVAAPDYGPEYRDVGASPRLVQSAGFSNAAQPAPLQQAAFPVESYQPKAAGFVASEMLNPTYDRIPAEGQRAPISSPYSPRSAPPAGTLTVTVNPLANMNLNEVYGVRIETDEGATGLGLELPVGPPPPPPKPRPALPTVRSNRQPAVSASVQMGAGATAGNSAEPGAVVGDGTANNSGARVLSPPVNV